MRHRGPRYASTFWLCDTRRLARSRTGLPWKNRWRFVSKARARPGAGSRFSLCGRTNPFRCGSARRQCRSPRADHAPLQCGDSTSGPRLRPCGVAASFLRHLQLRHLWQDVPRADCRPLCPGSAWPGGAALGARGLTRHAAPSRSSSKPVACTPRACSMSLVA